ncbi:MAG TPA: hypothetical protein VGR65_13225 [Casimicrobiaceae bacterium]|jgi:hypothetical protein|nr:hypothetical protein [Casimicrobiaceae bacterium]
MNRLFVGLLGSAFAFGSVAAMADDKTPAQPDDKAKLKADKDAAKPAAAKMTPEEKAAARKAARAKKLDNANDPYGKTPVRTPRGTPLIGDFDRRLEPLPPERPVQREPAKGKP